MIPLIWIIIGFIALIVLIYIIQEHVYFGRNTPNKGWTMFKIRKGKHYSLPLALLLQWNKNGIVFEFEITEEMFYKPRPTESHISKICGLSFGLNHHKDSARLGWNAYESRDGAIVIDLEAYCYSDGLSPQDTRMLKAKIGSVYEPGRYRCEILRDKSDDLIWWYGFHVENMESAYEDVEWSMILEAKPNKTIFPINRVLLPFYGGKGPVETAHEDTIIPLRIIKFS